MVQKRKKPLLNKSKRRKEQLQSNLYKKGDQRKNERRIQKAIEHIRLVGAKLRLSDVDEQLLNLSEGELFRLSGEFSFFLSLVSDSSPFDCLKALISSDRELLSFIQLKDEIPLV